MARVLLVSPPALWPRAAPLLSCAYLASSLLRAGHTVGLVDLGARHGPPPSDLGTRVRAFAPDLVGVTLYTEAALETYALVAAARRSGERWVAGGPHATAVPEEPLRHGFDLVVRGEGERALVELAQQVAAEGSAPLGVGVAGVSRRASDGTPSHEPEPSVLPDLDTLPPPHEATALVERSWYVGSEGGQLPIGLLTSRGCPGRCLFCASSISAHPQRHHSVVRVLDELRAARAREGAFAPISVYDESFTTPRERVFKLCAAIRDGVQPLPTWWCESRVAGFDDAMAEALVQAGCRSVVFGVESGDPTLRRYMGKPLSDEQVLDALRAARAAGLRTTICTMLGFPGEDLASLGRTRRFLERVAPASDAFAPMGVVTPLPGTPLHGRLAQQRRRAPWWLDPARLDVLHGPLKRGRPVDAAGWATLRVELEEAAVEANFFGLSAQVRKAIRDCLAIRRR